MTIRVVVLNWNGRRWLDGCLSALAAQTRPADEIVVVDNASSDDSVAYLRARWPQVTVVALDENLGFAEGNNRGAAGARTDALVFLNNDTEAEPGWLAALEAAARPPYALVASRIVFLDRPDVIDSAGDGYLRCGGGFKRGHGQPAAAFAESREVFGVCGAAFLVRRDLFERLGGFDPAFFMVYEDVDLSYRARMRGARVWYAAGAIVRHAGSPSLGRVSDRAVFYGQRNLEWTWIRNTPGRWLWRTWPAHLAYNLAGAVAYARRGRLRAWVRGKAAALAGVTRAWRARASVVDDATAAAVWAQMEPDWVGIKRREKRFSFADRASVEDDRPADE